MVRANVDRRRELKIIVDLSSAEVDQIKLEALQMKDKVIGHLFEASSG